MKNFPVIEIKEKENRRGGGGRHFMVILALTENCRKYWMRLSLITTNKQVSYTEKVSYKVAILPK